MDQIRFTTENDDGTEIEHDLPAKYEVCPRCRGKGSHDHSAFSNGITSSEWSEWDSEEQESYLKGDYDVPCEECKGLRVILIPDEDRCDKEILRLYKDHLQFEADLRREDRNQERFGY